jgi:hypothetical protein
VALPPLCFGARKSPSRSLAQEKVFAPVAATFRWAAFAVVVVVASRFGFSCHPDRGAAPFAAPTRDLSSIAVFTAKSVAATPIFRVPHSLRFAFQQRVRV